MKARNYHYYGTQAEIKRLAEEYEFLGRRFIIEPGHLTVLALPPKKVKKKVEERREDSRTKSEDRNEDRRNRQTSRNKDKR